MSDSLYEIGGGLSNNMSEIAKMEVRYEKYITIDGNEAAAHVAYAFTEVSAIYPITLLRPWQNGSMSGVLGGAFELIRRTGGGGGNAVRSGRCRCSSRLFGGGRLNYHVHRLAGFAVDDSQYV